MIATAHVLIGGATGVALSAVTTSPGVILVGSVMTHLAADALPHIDHPPAPKENGEVVWTPAVWAFGLIDVSIAVTATLALWSSHFAFPLLGPFIIGAIGGLLPDVIDNAPWWRKSLRRLAFFGSFHAFHDWLHNSWEKHFPMPQWTVLGIITQVAAGGLSLWFLLEH